MMSTAIARDLPTFSRSALSGISLTIAPHNTVRIPSYHRCQVIGVETECLKRCAHTSLDIFKSGFLLFGSLQLLAILPLRVVKLNFY